MCMRYALITASVNHPFPSSDFISLGYYKKSVRTHVQSVTNKRETRQPMRWLDRCSSKFIVGVIIIDLKHVLINKRNADIPL